MFERAHHMWFLLGSLKRKVEFLYVREEGHGESVTDMVCVSLFLEMKNCFVLSEAGPAWVGRHCCYSQDLHLHFPDGFFVCLFLGFLLLKFSLVGKPEWCWLACFELVVVGMAMWLLSLLGTWYDSQSSVKKCHNDFEIRIFGNIRTYWNLPHDCWANVGEKRKKQQSAAHPKFLNAI